MTPDKMVNLDLRISQNLPNFAQQNNIIHNQNMHFCIPLTVQSSFLLVCFRNIVLRPNEMTQRDILAGAISEVLWKVGLLNVKVNLT